MVEEETVKEVAESEKMEEGAKEEKKTAEELENKEIVEEKPIEKGEKISSEPETILEDVKKKLGNLKAEREKLRENLLGKEGDFKKIVEDGKQLRQKLVEIAQEEETLSAEEIKIKEFIKEVEKKIEKLSNVCSELESLWAKKS